jgi:hypothetical protein
MTPTKIGILVAVGIALFVGLGTWFAGISWYNDAISLEEATKAQYRDNQNEYDAFWKKVKETAQIPDKYKNDFKDLLVSETQAKFGPNGSQAGFQWFQDRQINFDASVYKKIQDIIESGRDDFKRSQTMLLDKQRAFGVQMRSYWGGMWAKHYDMPHSLSGELAPPKDLDGDGRLTVLDYPIVTSAKTSAAFQSGQDEALNVFDKK